MMHGPQRVKEEHQGYAGVIMALFLTLGLTMGSFLEFATVKLLALKTLWG
jgi:hypothetical protein